MQDLISRQAAIDAMEDVDWYHINSNGQLVHGANSKKDEPLYKAEDVYKVLNDVPSAQPEPCEDTISRQVAIRIVDGIDTWQAGWRGDAIESMKALPSAQPEMIREIRKWINSGNRGSADYFIVEKIEEIINKYE